ncbi:MAG: hypothetical protein K2G23_08460 [Muribaculaceae bacterium]|nr:hypothetical protein [Muribaculaceae bacterium]
MKKIKLLCLCIIMAMGCTFTSCSGIGNPEPEEVMTKINSGEDLDEADYATMVDYINDFCDEAVSSFIACGVDTVSEIRESIFKLL